MSEVSLPEWMIEPVLRATDEMARRRRMQDEDAAIFEAAVKHAYERFVRPKLDGTPTSAADRLAGLVSDGARVEQVYHDVMQELNGDLSKHGDLAWTTSFTGVDA